MNSETLLELVHRRPFEPFEIRLSNGEAHQIRHPENANVTKSKLVVVYPEADRVVVCSLFHVASYEFLTSTAA